MSCFQCELDIPHVCYEGMPNARWGWTDEAVAVLEGAQRHGFMLLGAPRRPNRPQQAAKKKRRMP
jgi:hypothetical protein